MKRLGNCIAMMDEGMARMSAAIPHFPIQQTRLYRLMQMVSARMSDELADTLKPNQLNESEFLTLMVLCTRPDGSAPPGELCEYTAQRSTNMTRIGNTLARRKLVSRGASTRDRRCVLMRITAAGRRFVQKLLPPMFPRVESVFDGFSAADRRELERLLRKLAHNLDAHDAP